MIAAASVVKVAAVAVVVEASALLLDPTVRGALIGAAITAIPTTIWWIIQRQAKARDEARAAQAEQAKQITTLQIQQALIGQQVLPLTAAWQKYLVDELTHLHAPVLDELMVKPDRSEEEDEQMLRLLRERMVVADPRIDPAERIAAEMLPLVLRFSRLKQAAKLVPDVIAVVKQKGPPGPTSQ